MLLENVTMVQTYHTSAIVVGIRASSGAIQIPTQVREATYDVNECAAAPQNEPTMSPIAAIKYKGRFPNWMLSVLTNKLANADPATDEPVVPRTNFVRVTFHSCARVTYAGANTGATTVHLSVVNYQD